ncbi:methyltransferase domain-containing protein [Candidatus Laterigemmans baculatus]|uniref:methyltransferase domain-containing protein n=1 Tax=Candidatus Laterigemmans baculatus TaxID=2770505 RepID=UPI0013DA8C2B|nr:methyltransferase domain-containing protein [Candidatus Laterigemmans baculatus]
MLYDKTDLHEERLDVAAQTLRDSGARSVLDLGCGSGGLLRRLVQVPQFQRIVGVDKCSATLWHAEQAIHHDCGGHQDFGGSQSAKQPARLSLIVGSYTDRNAELCGFDACAMIETIEHIDPGTLGSVEQSVFGYYRPKTVVLTTPNVEYNELLGLAPGEFRQLDHRFEWDREKFRNWSRGVAQRNGYQVCFRGIGEEDLVLGPPTQMALFTRAPRTSGFPA